MAVDSKLVKRYQAGIERALGLFDATSEWADFIAYLSRLLKALQDPPPDATLPLKTTIARHLAQCLRPTLPSGVHQKALDVYALIFTISGRDGLAQDLPLFLPGLSHTFAFASLSTRPQLLALYDDYILDLSAPSLRPALRALILSLLPGLEEETSEDFEGTLKTFNRLREKYVETNQEEVFWQALFLASVTNPNRRAGVLVYLARYLPRLGLSQPESAKDANEIHLSKIETITRPEPGLLVRCFATGLQDDQPLIQRGFLDLLVTHLPLQAQIFHHAQHTADLDVLVRSAAAVVLRRDMGLNRRLWSWFTGLDAKHLGATGSLSSADSSVLSPDATKGESRATEYFLQYGLQSMVRGIHFMLSTSSVQSGPRMRPFRIALSLMDRWEVGGPVVEATFIPLIQSLQSYQSNAPSQEAFDEVFRSANVFFDGIEGRLVASQLIRLLEQNELDLVYFVVSNFNLEDDEMMKRHIPLISLCVVERLHQSVSKLQQQLSSENSLEHIEKLCQIFDELLKLIGGNVLEDGQEAGVAAIPEAWKTQVLRFYEHSTSTTKSIMSPLPKSVMTAVLAHELCETYLHVLCTISGDSFISSLTSSLETYVSMTQGFTTFKQINFCPRLLIIAQADQKGATSYGKSISIARVISTLRIHDLTNETMKTDMLVQFVTLLTTRLWMLLQVSTPQYHVEVSDILWRLHSVTMNLRLVESTVLAEMANGHSHQTEHHQNILRFATLWTHAKSSSRSALLPMQTPTIAKPGEEVSELLKQPLLFLIDSTVDARADEALTTWIRTLNSLDPILRIVIGAIHGHMTDPQIIGLGLQRLSRLINLARLVPALWLSFCEEPGQADTILELCSLILSKETFAPRLGIHALELIQSMVRGGQYRLRKDFINLLSTQLAASYESLDLQGSLLDTLQATFSASANPQVAEILLPVLLNGMNALQSDFQIDKYVTLLCNVVPSLSPPTIMANLLKITSSLCRKLYVYFSALQSMYGIRPEDRSDSDGDSHQQISSPERSILNLLAGMEYILARAHHQASVSSDPSSTSVNGSTSDVPSSRSSANDQLTVVLCMQDALKACARIWLWRSGGRGGANASDAKSLHYMSSKLRGRTRRILENLIEAEPQECLETLMGLWVEKRTSNAQHGQILDLLQTLDGARPKFMMPATFNAIYNRTNPAALDRSQRSSLSVNVNAFELIAFLNDYTNALEDDLLDEIWGDCTTFLKEILSNPMPHRQILLKLLEFVAVLCTKMNNTNFGEESRMRKELADNCARLFTAIFTIKPNGLDAPGSSPADAEVIFKRTAITGRGHLDAGNGLRILYETIPDLTSCLSGSDRLLPIYVGIATNITGPLLHAKSFPATISPELLALLQTMTTNPTATKAWKKDLLDAFNDTRFFQGSVDLVELGWLPLIRQLVLIDKTVMSELLGRLIPPAAAGLMFGVGATAARTEADKKTQLTLRRIILLLLARENDYFVPNLQQLLLKLQELFTATVDSSPSLATRGEVYLTLRAVVLSFSQSQLSAMWPILDNELRELCNDILEGAESKYSMFAKLQGAKLLDLLLLLKPDEFQLHEWLFVTDTMDAIYPPDGSESIAYADRIGAVIPHMEYHTDSARYPPKASTARTPWLCMDDSRNPEKFPALLSSFFSQLSIRAFESNYSLERVDVAACRKDLIADIYTDS